MWQKSVKCGIVFTGKTPVHRGTYRAIVLQAPENHGILFVTPKGEAKAQIENAEERCYGISLKDKSGKLVVRVVEHWLAAFFHLGITNARVELDTDMPLVFDSSVEEIIRRIKGSELQQDAPKRIIRIEQFGMNEFTHSNGGPDMFMIKPTTSFKLTGIFDHPKARFAGRQDYIWNGERETFESDLMKARTQILFNPVFDPISRFLFSMSYKLGVHTLNTNNAIVSFGSHWENKLRYGGEEAVRHFVLDKIGALALLPFLIQGHVIFDKTGHSFDIEALTELCNRISRFEKKVPQTINVQ